MDHLCVAGERRGNQRVGSAKVTPKILLLVLAASVEFLVFVWMALLIPMGVVFGSDGVTMLAMALLLVNSAALLGIIGLRVWDAAHVQTLEDARSL